MSPTASHDGLSMPPEWAPHERTLMAWPCRLECWRAEIAAAKVEYAGVANAVASFEPVTMVCGSPADAVEARAALTAGVEIVELPLDDSWLRDSGPIYVAGEGRRAGVCFGFNAWGEKYQPHDKDEAIGALLVELGGDEVRRAPFVLEGGAIANDGAGALIVTEQCLLHPNRNPSMSREDIEAGLVSHLGAERVVWLGYGLSEDRDTDGHVDMVCLPLSASRVLLQSTPAGTPDHDAMADNAHRLRSAGIDVVDFPVLTHGTVAGERVVHSYLNTYVCNGAAIVPLAGTADDDEALARLAEAFGPDREIVGVPGLTIAYGGGGPHCITQQMPRI
jgi:agmatine deiminase